MRRDLSFCCYFPLTADGKASCFWLHSRYYYQSVPASIPRFSVCHLSTAVSFATLPNTVSSTFVSQPAQQSPIYPIKTSFDRMSSARTTLSSTSSLCIWLLSPADTPELAPSRSSCPGIHCSLPFVSVYSQWTTGRNSYRRWKMRIIDSSGQGQSFSVERFLNTFRI